MKTLVKLTLILNLLLAANCFSQEITVRAVIDESRQIYLGTRFNYSILIDGTDEAGTVDTSPLAGLDFEGPSVRNLSQQSIRIINGRRSVDETKRYVMSYQILATELGEHEIPSLKVVVGGKTYQTNPVNFTVIEPQKTDMLHLEVDLSKETCYVGEPVTLTIKWYIAGKIAREIGDFVFDITPFKEDSFITDDVSGFGDTNAKDYQMNGVPVKAEQKVVTRNGRQEIALIFKKVLIPQETGSYNFSPSRLTTQIAVRTRKSRNIDSFFDDFLRKEYRIFAANSQQISLDVKPLPQTDKPSDYHGLVGEYHIEATAQPTEVKVGDPITLTINVKGEYLKPVVWPSLEKVSGFSDGFIIPEEKSTPKYENGQKQFVQTIRAKSDKVTEIPEIPLTYFDVDSGKYETVYSEPVKLDVEYNKTLTITDIEGLDLDSANSSLKSSRKGLSANYEGRWLLNDERFTISKAVMSPVLISLLSFTFASLVFSAIARLILSKDPEKVKRKQQKSAAAKACKAIRKAAKLDPRDAKEKLGESIRVYLSERFNKQAKAITPHDCQVLLEEFNADLATEMAGILSDCQDSEYSPVKSEFNPEWCTRTIEIITNLESKISK